VITSASKQRVTVGSHTPNKGAGTCFLFGARYEGIQTKVTFNIHMLAQALENPYWTIPGPHYRAIAFHRVPAAFTLDLALNPRSPLANPAESR